MFECIDSMCVPTSIVAIGAGNRMRTYMHYVEANPGRVRLVAVVEPDEVRRKALAAKFGLPPQRQFDNYETFFRNPVEADAVFICTPEREHYAPCIAALKHGYHVLLEKPIAQTYEQCRHIADVAKETGRLVCICHVLRYHPCFRKIKELVDSGQSGKIITVTHIEDVGIERATHSYVRGSMNTEAGNNPMLLAKCCHDIDFLAWLSGQECSRLSSFGSLRWFRAENAPAGAADRCVDCAVERECPYSALDLYGRRRQWIANFDIAEGETLDDAIRRELTHGPFGRCVYRCDNDVVDNQVLTMQMADGTLMTLCMDVFTRRDGRRIDIRMSRGEIVSDGKTVELTDFATGNRILYDFTEEAAKPFHGGADLRLVESFINAIRGEGDTQGLTTVEESLRSHLLCFEAERSRRTGKIVTPGRG